MIRLRLFPILWLCSVTASTVVADTSPSITATLSTNRIHVGDRVDLAIAITHDASERFVIPSINREPFIVVWDSRAEYKNTPDGKRISTTRISFSSFVIGEHRVYTGQVIQLTADGAEESVAFPILLLNVESILTNPPPALADIKPPATLSDRAWLRVLLILLAILVAAVLAAWLLKLWLRRAPKPVQRRIVPPEEIAMAALQALIARGFIEKGESEPFYIELSDIVRLYIEQRFDLHAPEQTTEEFIRASSQSNLLSADHRALTQSFLEQSDLVKFARFEPLPDDMKTAWEAGVKLVRETSPATARQPGGAA